jgi:hypothetical protein
VARSLAAPLYRQALEKLRQREEGLPLSGEQA